MREVADGAVIHHQGRLQEDGAQKYHAADELMAFKGNLQVCQEKRVQRQCQD